MNQKTTFLYPLLSGFLGASLALYGPSLARDVYAYGGGAPVRSTSLVLEDASGHRKITLDRTPDGGSALFFFDSKDRSRMEVGTYGDGLPFVVLESEQHTPKALLRMAGPNQSGVLVFKDKHNRDRMILGLDMNDANEDPFLVTFDREGRRKVIFGQASGFAH